MIYVVAAVQSPTLLNILAISSAWSLRTYAMGDHAGLAETSEMLAPVWDEASPAPEVVLVCTPAHRELAMRKWPTARRLWVLHNGYEPGLLPPECENGLAGVVCFSEKVRWIRQASSRTRCHFVSPAYVVKPLWTWQPNALWTLRSRPRSRHDDRDCVFAAVVQGAEHKFYGQGQQAGFADSETKRRMLVSSSAYVSCLMRSSGFGLAEHEAFAAGVPVVGGWWGDLAAELPVEYWSLSHDLYTTADAAKRLASKPDGAGDLSELGFNYIRKYRSAERMNESIAELLRQVG